EDATVVKTDAFKNAVPVEKAVIEDRDLRFRFVHQFSVEPNFHVDVSPKRRCSTAAGKREIVESGNLLSLLPIFIRITRKLGVEITWIIRDVLTDPGWQRRACVLALHFHLSDDQS